jgi:hypothetical protein
MAPYPDVLFKNNGNGSFSDATPHRWRGDSHSTMGIAYADYNNDGWTDFVLGQWNEGYALFRNTGADSPRNHWLTLRLIGAGAVNQNAVGARVYLTTSDGRTQMQDVICGSSLGSGNDLALHFGLGTAAVKQLRIVWPDRTENLINDVAFDHIIQVSYPNAVHIITAKEHQL